MPRHQGRRKAAAVALSRIATDNGVAIIEDDVMRPLVDNPPPALAALELANSFFITTLSKAVSGGPRVAFVACPEGMAATLGEGVWATQYMVPPLMAELAAAGTRKAASGGLATDHNTLWHCGLR